MISLGTRLVETRWPLAIRTGLLAFFWLFVGSDSYSQNKGLLSDRVIGREFTYVVQSGDSLTAVGARFGVAPRVVARGNDVPPEARLKIGQKLQVDNRHIVPREIDDGIVINLPQRMLFLMKSGQVQGAYPVGLGKPDWPTPTGRFRIVVKEENPTWEVPKSIQEEMEREGKTVTTCVPPGPDNPLGKHWLGLSVSGYGIHGTIAPSSIFQFQTHGCIRMHPDDIGELFKQVERGTRVHSVYRRWLIARVGARLMLETHGDIYGKQPDVEHELRRLAEREDLTARIDWQRAKYIIDQSEGIARDITKQE